MNIFKFGTSKLAKQFGGTIWVRSENMSTKIRKIFFQVFVFLDKINLKTTISSFTIFENTVKNVNLKKMWSKSNLGPFSRLL